jgi:hypothetical protein
MKRIFSILTLVVFLLITTISFAQPAGGPPPPPPPPTGGAANPPCWPPPCIPIDGGIGFLVIAGAALGVKKMYDHKKSKPEVE